MAAMEVAQTAVLDPPSATGELTITFAGFEPVAVKTTAPVG
jgi:hypothetical protein